MNTKTITTLNKKYDEFNVGKFDLPYSEILFYSALDSLEFFYKKISEIKPLSKEDEYEFEYLKNLTDKTIDIGFEVLKENHTSSRREKMRDFFKRYGEIIVFAEEIPQ